ncbi:MAG: nucleoside triphosphate pyrophosphohydrolase [Bdellovibrionales bacterium]
MSQINESLNAFESFVKTVRKLRSPDGGCPWDLEQDLQSLKKFCVEEAFEYADAVDRENINDIKEELGDVLLQVVLNSVVAEQENKFNLQEVIQSIDQKMIRRHPHVFSDLKLENSKEVETNWQEIKNSEQSNKSKIQKMFGSPQQLPALMGANRIGKKSANYNFDWEKPEDVLKKIEEELSEVKEAMKQQSPSAISEEIGDLLFSTAQLARHYKMDPEECLRKTNQKFLSRFELIVESVEASKKDWEDHSIEELEQLWVNAKNKLKRM